MNKANRILESLFVVHNKLNEIAATPRDFGTGDLLYYTEIHTLVVIAKRPGINLTQLSKSLGVSKSAASKFVKKLLHKDYLVKSKAVDNQREVLFNLTPKGICAYQGHELFSEKKFDDVYKLIKKYSSDSEAIISFLEELGIAMTKLK